MQLPIRNVNRTVGTMLGSEVTRRYGAEGLPDDTIRIQFNGSAGQSFGAFLPNGISSDARRRRQRLFRQGTVGRAASWCFRRRAPTFKAEENIIIGNVALVWRDRWRSFHSRRRRRAFCGPQQRRHGRRRRRRRSRLRIHDPRPCRRARPNRTKFRGRHERRHRLRHRRGRRFRAALQSRDGRSRTLRRCRRRNRCPRT